jgi:hypothetical protein
MIRLVEIALVIGKNLILIMAAFVGITFATAMFNFAVGNIVWGIVGLAFGISGLVFLAQIRQTRRRHYRRQATYQEKRQKHREAQAA